MKLKSKASVAQTGSRGLGGVGEVSPFQTMYNIPPPIRLREEARIQEEVQTRPRHLADNVKPDVNKIKSQRGGALDICQPLGQMAT